MLSLALSEETERVDIKMTSNQPFVIRLEAI